MTIGLDQAPAQVTDAGGQLPELTTEKARELAAVLAEHMLAMRAVTAGTRYGAQTGPGLQPLSPATEIFLAGMLDRIRAEEDPDPACAARLEAAQPEAAPLEAAPLGAARPEAAESGSDDIAVSGLAVLAG